MPVARIWRTQIDPSRAAEYAAFWSDHSLPMFRAHDGFIGAIVGNAAHGAGRVVITLWTSVDAAARLEASPVYQAVVRQIEQTGFIAGPSTVEVFHVDGPDLIR